MNKNDILIFEISKNYVIGDYGHIGHRTALFENTNKVLELLEHNLKRTVVFSYIRERRAADGFCVFVANMAGLSGGVYWVLEI